MNLAKALRRSEGQVLILTVLSLVVLIGLSALAIDLGMAYAVKAKLSSAVDAASLAAGKAVKTGENDATRRANAIAAANSYFAANFPAGILGSTSPVFRIDPGSIVNDNAGTWTINVSASATAPTFFGRMFSMPATVNASAETTVKTLDMMIVLDCSTSLGTADFRALQSAAKNFVEGFQQGDGGDRIGLVTFASGAVLDAPINKTSTRGFSKKSLTTLIDGASMGGMTNAEEAMRIAKKELDAIDPTIRSTLRVIVFFSDGAPNIVSGSFMDYDSHGGNGHTVTGGLFSIGGTSGKPTALYTITARISSPTTATNIQILPSTDYLSTVYLASFNGARTLLGNPVTNTWCNVNMAARNMVENLANSARDGAGNAAVTIYTIGLGNRLRTNEADCHYGSSEYGENILKRIANTSDSDRYQASQPTGMYVWAADASQLNSAFQKVKSIILRISK